MKCFIVLVILQLHENRKLLYIDLCYKNRAKLKITFSLILINSYLCRLGNNLQEKIDIYDFGFKKKQTRKEKSNKEVSRSN